MTNQTAPLAVTVRIRDNLEDWYIRNVELGYGQIILIEPIGTEATPAVSVDATGITRAELATLLRTIADTIDAKPESTDGSER